MKDVIVRIEHKYGYKEHVEVEPNTVEYAKRWIKHARKDEYYASLNMGIYQRVKGESQ
jgi:hypothetical protein